MHRLSKTLIEVCVLKSHASRSFFLVFIVRLPVLSYLTAMREAILTVKEWNRKMKIKQRRRRVGITNLRNAYISDQKSKSVYFKLRPLPPVVTPLPNTVYAFFLGSEEGPWQMAQWTLLCTLTHGALFQCLVSPCVFRILHLILGLYRAMTNHFCLLPLFEYLGDMDHASDAK